jgi:hypothetical protein
MQLIDEAMEEAQLEAYKKGWHTGFDLASDNLY